jgi:hypothetical protein
MVLVKLFLFWNVLSLYNYIKGEKWTNTEQYFQSMKFRGPQATPMID